MQMPRSKFKPHRKPAQGKAAALAFLAANGLMLGWAQAAEPPGPSLQSCRALTDGQARLSCYDALADQAAKQPQALAAPPASMPTGTATAAAVAPVAVAAAGADTFGLSQKSKDEPNVIRSQITGLFQGWGPNRIIDLSNGQSWQVADGSSAVLYLKSPKVEIRKAAMGTFMLELEGSNETARVKRVR